MKLKILSLVLIIMLVSLPITHVMAMPIEDDCKRYFTVNDLKNYIINHVRTGHTEHCAVVDIDRNDFDPKKECHTSYHNHNQVMRTIAVKEVCKIQYKCLDRNGYKWCVDIEGKIGRDRGVYWNDETLWKNAITSPCATYQYSYVYDVNNRYDLMRLFKLMVGVDQYLDNAKGMDVFFKLSNNLAGGGVGIASTFLTLAKYSGRIPYIGEVISVTASTGIAVWALYKFADDLHKIDVLKKHMLKVIKNNCWLD